MKKFKLKEIASKIEGKVIRGNDEIIIGGISIDSRTVKEDNIFFPIIGSKNDGHDFIKSVIENGCHNIVVSDEKKIPKVDGINVILVDDTTEALKLFGKNYLKEICAKKIAITGSVGKTTTRDMVYSVCKEKYRTGRNVGNLNSIYGVPLTIAGFDEDLEVVVLEIGMDHKGEIDELVDIINPDIGIITNVGISHIENFENGRDGILAAKMEIVNRFTSDSLLIVNNDSDMLSEDNTKGQYRLQSVGTSVSNNPTALISDIRNYGDEGIEYTIQIDELKRSIRLNVLGVHNALNSALAILAGMELGIDIDTSIRALQNMELTGKRLTIRENEKIKVIDDTYNACPASMKSAIKTLMATDGKRKIAILGDMYELGNETEKSHNEVGRFAGEMYVDLIIAVGELGKYIIDGVQNGNIDTMYYDDKEKLYEDINGILREGDTVLVKASRGMMMETVVDKIINEYK